MEARSTSHRIRALLSTDRAVQVVWLLFTLLCVSLALPGIAPYNRLLGVVCSGADCLPGQSSPDQAQGTLSSLGATLPEIANVAIVAYLLTSALSLLTAAALIRLKPGHPAAVFGSLALSAAGTGTLALAASRSFPVLEPLAQTIHFVLLATLLPFFGLIPDGRFRPAWMRWIALALLPVTALAAFDMVGIVARNAVTLGIAGLILVALVYQYRSLPASPQQEMVAWALAAAALMVAAPWTGTPIRSLRLEVVPVGFFPTSLVGTFMVAGALTCLAVAFLRHELFRVEVVVNRALVYSLLSLFVVAGYVLVVGYLSLIFQSSGSLWFSLIATGLMAVLFQPVRERVQRFVNRLLYGERAEPYAVIAGLGTRLEATFAPEAVLPTIAQMVQESLQLPYVAIALEQAGACDVAVSAGTPRGPHESFPLSYQGTRIGELRVNPRYGDATLDATDRALLTDLAQQAGIAVHSVRLTTDLRQMAGRLQQARERLVLALEEERRRLRRDLHDDLAPTLVGLSLRAGTIADLVETDPDRVRELADGLDDAIRDAVSNIRRLVYDLRPPALDDLGLVAAIRERAHEFSAGAGPNIVVDAPDLLPPLPAAVEVAAYRIVQEGMLNVVRHAEASSCRVCVAPGDWLRIEIADDGVGMPGTTTGGVGLRSIRERAEELGGRCRISSGAHKGSIVSVHLPIDRGETP